eukprot:CAMPEP_0179245246 /NCGR_PEP_ID=MMETSP0797-20121207/18473_1 /TAXON_ID=47934 /ORGANISM="Dinophysis acuminata, Strain DAEP01" /LENGTH=361 /DNA_ID=CAMNT_0020952785 /DNA_START=39 /DNA_END=1124 /DNA_ORIENTATION=-
MVVTGATPIAWPYPIGKLNEPWTSADKEAWRKRADQVQRSYQEEVLDKLNAIYSGAGLSSTFDLLKYGSLSQNPDRYPLYLLRTKPDCWDAKKPSVLVTGGVHGYETSGVQGALLFIEEALSKPHPGDFASKFNFVIAPCVSPWGYEAIQRWAITTTDVNRSFLEKGDKSKAEDAENGRGEGRTEESAQLMDFIDASVPGGRGAFKVHLDLHETTDTDATEFRPAKKSKDGLVHDRHHPEESIPVGFYLVGDSEVPHETRSPFMRAILKRVSEVTKICEDREILGMPIETEDGKLGGEGKPIGVLYAPVKKLALCAGQTDAAYAVTTEVYPDVDGVTGEECNRAQYHAVLGALEYYAGVCM